MSFLEYFRKYIKRLKPDQTFCEQILGHKSKKHRFARFWEQHAEDIHVFSAYSINEVMSTEDYNKEEFLIYKKAISELPMFFEKCWNEVEAENMEK